MKVVLSPQSEKCLKKLNEPIITLLIAEESIVETDLTDEEKEIIKRGRIEYMNNPDSFVALDSVM